VRVGKGTTYQLKPKCVLDKNFEVLFKDRKNKGATKKRRAPCMVISPHHPQKASTAPLSSRPLGPYMPHPHAD
jgi:hypothetical protein